MFSSQVLIAGSIDCDGSNRVVVPDIQTSQLALGFGLQRFLVSA